MRNIKVLQVSVALIPDLDDREIVQVPIAHSPPELSCSPLTADAYHP